MIQSHLLESSLNITKKTHTLKPTKPKPPSITKRNDAMRSREEPTTQDLFVPVFVFYPLMHHSLTEMNEANSRSLLIVVDRPCCY